MMISNQLGGTVAKVSGKPTIAQARHQRVSAKSLTPSDEVFQPLSTQSTQQPINRGSQTNTSSSWRPAGYATASGQASRLAYKDTHLLSLPPPESSRPLTSITSRINVNAPTTTSKITTTLLKIQELHNSLDSLESRFIFPSNLDFLLEPLSFDSSPIGNLNLSPTNDPIREHKECLIQIQTELNSIPECDDTRVRMSLKKAVDKVEEALLKLENEVSRRVQEWRTRNSRVRGLHAERPMPQASRQSAATPFSESFLHIDGHPIYPVVSSDIAQLIGDDPRLHTTFLDISSEISKVQVQRLDSLTNGRSTHELDDSLRVIYRNWEEFIRSLIIVKRSEERNGLALLGWRTGEGDLPPVLEAENDVDEDQAHYLSLVLDPNKTDS